jgi:hypothetical protein
VAVLDGLLVELELAGAKEWFPAKGLQQGPLAVALGDLLKKPEADVQKAAARAYRKLFGADPSDYVRKAR